jgi:hypothetical protein
MFEQQTCNRFPRKPIFIIVVLTTDYFPILRLINVDSGFSPKVLEAARKDWRAISNILTNQCGLIHKLRHSPLDALSGQR